jgi:hypothetical protein
MDQTATPDKMDQLSLCQTPRASHTCTKNQQQQEALYVCRGPEGANAVMRMSPAAQDELWRCVVSGRGPAAAPGWAGLRAVPGVVSGGEGGRCRLLVVT